MGKVYFVCFHCTLSTTVAYLKKSDQGKKKEVELRI